jgi:hypothetical protein
VYFSLIFGLFCKFLVLSLELSREKKVTKSQGRRTARHTRTHKYAGIL